MPVDFYKRGPAISDADIDAFEKRIGHVLPADYREFLLRINGGRPCFHVIRNQESGDVGVKIFFGICDEEYFDLDAEFRDMRGRWPDRLMSIAIDDCGDRFCLSLDSPNYGAVYYWDHELEAEEGEEPTESNLTYLASSFSEFWERIEPIDRDAYLAEQESKVEENAKCSNSVPKPPWHTNGASG